MGTIPSSSHASTRRGMASTFACVSNCGHPGDAIQMCKFCSEREWGIRIKLLGKALVPRCGSMNRVKSKSPPMRKIRWAKCEWGKSSIPLLWVLGERLLPWQRARADGGWCLVVPYAGEAGTCKSFGGASGSASNQSFAFRANSRCELEHFYCSWLENAQ